MEHAPTEVSSESHLALVREVADHISVVLFTKDSMESDKPVPVVNLQPIMFIDV